MPQAIALQRGQLSMSNNTTSLVFTGPSTGSATRVIVGYLSWTTSAGLANGYCTFSVLRNGSASPNYSIFAASNGNYNTYTTSFSPHNVRTGWHASSTTTNENSPVLSNSSNAGLIGATCLMQTTAGPMLAFYNSDIMIGPSDAIYCSWSDNSGNARTATVQYCFVTVNE